MDNIILLAFIGFVCYICANADNKRVMRRVGGVAIVIVLVIYSFVLASGGYHDPDGGCPALSLTC